MSISSKTRPQTSIKASQFSESVIRGMTRFAALHKAINLGQGLPDFPSPPELKAAACAAINGDINQYALTWGDQLLREAIAEKASRYLNMKIDPDKNVTVTCGSTEAMIATMLATVDPGDEAIVFEPYYENYGPDAILGGATPRYVSLKPPYWTFDENELKKAFNDKTRCIIINTPHNPTGKVFNREELQVIAEQCQKWGVMAFTDEIYEHILYDGHKHVAIGSLPGMEDLTVTINGLSKTYSVTGWRLGYIFANEVLTGAIRKVHDFLTVGAPAPLQRAGVVAMKLGQDYYDRLTAEYTGWRKTMLEILDESGIKYYTPGGAYYVFCDIGEFDFNNDVEFAQFLAKDIGVAVVPGSGFFRPGELGRNYVRFCFSRKEETLEEARRRMGKFREKVSVRR